MRAFWWMTCVWLATSVSLVAAQATEPSASDVAFPLQLSANGRYLVDQQKKPFLLKEISAWGLIQALPESEAAAFMDAAKAHGFNTLMVSAISWDQRFAGNPPDWNGNSPFLTEWDFSTPNPTYFEHVDRVLELARAKGLLVLLVPAYLGYGGDSTQGWAARLLDGHNSAQKSLAYGRFLGSRYKNASNIIWLAGGDDDGAGALYAHLSNIITGIKENATQLWTGHWNTNTVWSTNNTAYAKWMDIDSLYAWTEVSLGSGGPQYKSELERYGRGKLLIQLDQSYERDVPYAADNMDPQWIRRKNYDGLLSGCAGTSFSPGTDDDQLYLFDDWRPLMSTQGMNEARYTFALFESRAWHELVPDVSGSLVVAGRGTYGDVGYACAARTQSGSTLIVYVPSPRSITVDMTKVSGTNANAWWFNPRTGTATLLGTYPTTGQRAFSAPSGGDSVLVLDDASAGLPAPGASGAALPPSPAALAPVPSTPTTPTTPTTPAAPYKVGVSDVLPLDDNGNDNLLIGQSVTLATPAKLQSLSFYVVKATGKLRLGLYDATGASGGPGKKRGETQELTPVAGWNTANVTATTSLTAGTYWLVYLPSAANLSFKRGASGTAAYARYNYGALPAQFPSAPLRIADKWSFYATVSP